MYLVRPPYLLKNIFPKAVWRIPVKEKLLYLTFDDGPIESLTPWVLDTLKEKKINATFFCVGENVQKNQNIYQRILQEGHLAANHTHNHLNGWETHTAKYLKNVLQCESILMPSNSHLGRNGEKLLFRPPYGKMKKSQYKFLNRKYKIVMWDVLSGDFDKKTTKEKCLSNVINNVRNGSIIVFHDNIKAEENLRYTLPLFIDWALHEGYSFKLIQ